MGIISVTFGMGACERGANRVGACFMLEWG